MEVALGRAAVISPHRCSYPLAYWQLNHQSVRIYAHSSVWTSYIGARLAGRHKKTEFNVLSTPTFPNPTCPYLLLQTTSKSLEHRVKQFKGCEMIFVHIFCFLSLFNFRFRLPFPLGLNYSLCVSICVYELAYACKSVCVCTCQTNHLGQRRAEGADQSFVLPTRPSWNTF